MYAIEYVCCRACVSCYNFFDFCLRVQLSCEVVANVLELDSVYIAELVQNQEKGGALQFLENEEPHGGDDLQQELVDPAGIFVYRRLFDHFWREKSPL